MAESGSNPKSVIALFEDQPKKVISRKKKKNFERSQHHFKPRDERKIYDGARHVRRRKKLEDLMDQLEALRLDEDGKYIDSDDDDQFEVTPFDCLFLEEENMAIWECFINSSEEDQFEVLRKRSEWKEEKKESLVSTQAAYSRINCRLRHFLKRKHIPRQQLEMIELALIEYFIDKPLSTYITTIPDSYQRLVFHAVSQYLNLEARSYDSRGGGGRRTRVLSKHNPFTPPLDTLANHIHPIQT